MPPSPHRSQRVDLRYHDSSEVENGAASSTESVVVPAAALPEHPAVVDSTSAAAGVFVVKHRSNIPSLVAALSASMVTGGTTYAFGLYGNDLKRSLSLSSSEIDTISTAFFFAGLLSWIPGLSADRFGTKFSIATGGITGAVALHMYWSVATKAVHVERELLVPVLSLLGISIFLSCAMITGSVFKIIVSCCGPGTKGSAVGVAKGLVGLGSGFYTCIFGRLRNPDESSLDFLLLAAFLSILAATIPALLLLPSKAQADRSVMVDDATPRHFRILFASLAIMACLIVWDSLETLTRHHAASNESEDGSGGHVPLQTRNVPAALTFLAIWLLPIVSLQFLPHRRQRQRRQRRLNGAAYHEANGPLDGEDAEDEDEHDGVEWLADVDGPYEREASDDASTWLGRQKSDASRGGLSMKPVTADLPQEGGPFEKNDDEDEEANEGRVLLSSDPFAGSPRRDSASPLHERNADPDVDPADPSDNNKNLIQVLRTPAAWLMLWTTTILVGAGTLETNSMGEMVEALGLPSTVTSSSLALFSVAQAVSRVATGAVSESALNWNTKRFWIDAGIPRPFFLVLASCLAALSHLMLGIASRQLYFVIGSMLSGAAFGMVWPLMVLIVGEVFGVANAGANYMFYDGFSSAIGTLLLTKGLAQHVYEYHADADSNTCSGPTCFRLTQLVVAAASVTCIATSLGLSYWSRCIYNKQSVHHA
jgi:MFS family permease